MATVKLFTDAEADAKLVTGQWLANMAQRLPSEDVEQMVDLAQRLDEGASRFERLTNEINLP